MKTLISTGLVLAAMTASVLAQQPAPPPSPSEAQSQPSTPLTPVPEVMAPADTHTAQGHETPPLPTSPRDWALHQRRRGPPPPPPSRAAHFRIEQGETKIDVKCADDEPTKVCSDVLLQILDKLGQPSSDSDDERN